MNLVNKKTKAQLREEEFQNRIRNHYQILKKNQHLMANHLLRAPRNNTNPLLPIQFYSPPALPIQENIQEIIQILPPHRSPDKSDNFNEDKNSNLVYPEETTPVLPKSEKINSIIPFHIFQTWHSLDLPPKMKENIEQLKQENPQFHHHLYDDAMCRDFITDHFHENVVYAYDKLKPGAYKSDLWRYCILYVYGGIYLDIKYKCVNGFKFLELTDKEYYVKDRNYSISDDIPGCHGIYQALLASFPQRKLYYDCIQKIVKNCINNKYNYNDLDVTGPHMIGSLLNHNIEICNLELSFTGDSIVRNEEPILVYYEEYRAEQQLFQKTEYYKKMWVEKNIYSYPTLRTKKTIDISKTKKFMVLGKEIDLYSGTPSIVEYKEGYLINVRWINYNYNEDGSKKWIPLQWLSMNTRYRANAEFEKISHEVILEEDFEREQYYDGIGLEDIRMIQHNNNYYYIASYFDEDRKITSTSSFPFTYQEDSYILERNLILPQFYDLEKIKIIEKNWSFFDYKGDLCVVYKWFPLQICKIDYESKKLNRIEIKYDIPDYFEDVRGSTPGSKGSEIWFVLHKAQNYRESDKIYFNYQHFFAVFDTEMNLLRYSELFKFGDCKVEFCTGLIVKDSEIIITYSLLDTQSMISVYDKDHITTAIKWHTHAE
jgi:hypothetical protein